MEHNKNRALKCKVITNDLLYNDPLMNPSKLNPRDKKKFLLIMEEWFSKHDDEIDKEFNDIVNNKIFYNADHIEKIFVETITEPLPHLEVEKLYKKTENI